MWGWDMSTKSTVSRRSLLAGVAASAIVPWRPSRAAPSRGPDWDDLAKLIDSPVLLPNDPRFVNLTQPENLYYYRPMAVVRPPTPDAIAKSVWWAADRNIPLVARSGGHSYAGCSTIPGLIINTAALREVRYDQSSNLLEIGGGALNADIFMALQEQRSAAFKDGMAIVHGRCGAVGASAYLMGGGIGFDMRSFGAGCDLVDSVDVALANGNVVTASKDPDEGGGRDDTRHRRRSQASRRADWCHGRAAHVGLGTHPSSARAYDCAGWSVLAR
jgi:FAD/FMN-containing dehydrogenase